MYKIGRPNEIRRGTAMTVISYRTDRRLKREICTALGLNVSHYKNLLDGRFDIDILMSNMDLDDIVKLRQRVKELVKLVPDKEAQDLVRFIDLVRLDD